MGRSQETFGKKEVRTRKEKKRKDKEQKKALRKNDGKKNSFDDMIAYVDEFGVISSTPPDPDKKTVVIADQIELGATKKPETASNHERKGIVTYFNDSKGFGFINDQDSGQRIFFHVNNLLERVKENDIVIFEITRGPKGNSAVNVSIFKEQTPTTPA